MSITLLKNELFVLLFLLANVASVYSQCENTGPKSGSTAASVPFAGSGFSFSNPHYALTSDNSSATSTGLLQLFQGNTEYLRVTNFNFNIPDPAIICGIKVEVEKSATNIGSLLGLIGLAYVKDHQVRLVSGGSVVGDNKAKSEDWTKNESYHTYGGETDIWNVAWTSAQVNDPGFGVAISAHISGILGGVLALIPIVHIDHVRVTVYYQETLLPNHFLSFTTTRTHRNTALIQWKTPTELKDVSFNVERSLDGVQWQTVPGDIRINNNAGNILHALEDLQPLTGKSYYRVVATTTSGSRTSSSLTNFYFENENNIRIYPNPFTDRLTLSGIAGTQPVTITDLSGRVVMQTITTNGTLHLQTLKPGLYLLKTNNQTFKLQKL
jgi:hypothetical protein